MKIKKITSQHRRDFTAVYICEHCEHTITSSGYDDSHFHSNVIPEMICENCQRTSPTDYRPLTTKHPEGKQL